MLSQEIDTDVLVVGAGATGCAIASELASDCEVMILDKETVSGEASGLAAGLVAPTLFMHEEPEAATHANRFFRSFSGTGDFEYNERHRVEIVRPEFEDEARRQVAEMEKKGFPVSFIDAAALEDRHSAFDLSAFAGAIEIGDAGFVDDPYVYTQALAENAVDQGAEIRTGVEVTEIHAKNGEITGVQTDVGDFHASTVVMATGWRTRDLVSEYIDLPVRPFVLQCVTLDPPTKLDADFPLGRLPTDEVYFRPQLDGNLRLGGGEYFIEDPESRTGGVNVESSSVEQTEAPDRTFQETANASDADRRFVDHAAEVVPSFLDGFDDPDSVEFLQTWAGVGSANPDPSPILDAPDGVPDGLVIATGFNGLGITKSPVAAAAVRALITGEDAPFPLQPYSFRNRSTYSLDFTLQDTFRMGRK